MKAYVLHGIGEINYEEAKKPLPQAGEVLLKVMVAGICGSDIPRIYKTGAYHHPLIPGHEFAGRVEGIGPGVSEKWNGKRVGVFPLMPCKECLACKKKKYEMCKQYSYLGSRTDGGFAEYVRVPEWNLIALPDQVSYEQAAMMEPMAVAVHAICKSGIMTKDKSVREDLKEKKIAVCGLGTIGLFVIMFLRELGCNFIYAVGNKEFQAKKAELLGVEQDCFCNDRRENMGEWLLSKTQGEGVDVFFECVGRNEVLEQGLNGIAPEGRIVLVGNPASDIGLKKELYWKILRKQMSLQGTWNSSFTHEEQDDWHYVLERLENGRIKPEEMITHRLSFGDMERGFKMMRDKKEDYVKVMGIIEEIKA